MFDLGLQELIVIFVVALLAFGPKKLPELAQTMGKGIGNLKRAVVDAKGEIDREAQMSELHENLKVPTIKDELMKAPEGGVNPPQPQQADTQPAQQADAKPEDAPQVTSPDEHEGSASVAAPDATAEAADPYAGSPSDAKPEAEKKEPSA